MKKQLFIALGILVLSLGVLSAQPPSKPVLTIAAPESAGMSPERLNRIDKVIKEYIDKKWTNGAVAMIVRNGKIIYYKGFGYDDIETKKPLQKDAIFRIASQTKAITSVAVMILYEEGKLLLDDPISKYIPEFKNPKVLDKFNAQDSTYSTVPAKREVSIRDLLTHTSGIGYAQIGSPEANAIYYKNGITAGIGLDTKILGDDMKKLGGLPLMHQPGEKWTYGLNLDLLGYLVEVLSGMPLNEFFKKRIFDPLGMHDTFFYLPLDKQDRLVNLYDVDSTGALSKSPEFFNHNGGMKMDYPKLKGSYYSGGGGLSSTVMDYAIFLQMLLNDGTYNGKRILSRNSIRMMTMNQIGDLSLGAYKFGLGFSITTEKASALLPVQEGSFSWGGAFSTTYWADPKEKIVGLIYKQLWGDQHGELADKFRVLVYQAIND
jgi:CubicO group peptidase (beta-lactamase class C family)